MGDGLPVSRASRNGKARASPLRRSILPDWFLPVLVAPFIGSFLGVLVRRLPAEEGFALGRSRCESCGAVLGPAEMVPIASYLALRGRCRHCGATIAARHLWIELAALGIAIWAATLDEGARLWVDCGLGWVLLALGWIDAEHLILPDLLTLPLIPAGLAWAWLEDPDTLLDRAAGAATGYAAFRLIEVTYRRLRGRDGLGEGDAKLLAGAGAWLGWQGLGPVVLTAAVGGLLTAAGARLAGRKIEATTQIPFGPFLAGAFWLVWLYLT
jgi:leader peptidase (prepilin peptidase)/N-methyltransferase